MKKYEVITLRWDVQAQDKSKTIQELLNLGYVIEQFAPDMSFVIVSKEEDADKTRTTLLD